VSKSSYWLKFWRALVDARRTLSPSLLIALPVELALLFESDPKRLQQFFATGFLAVDSRDLVNPSDPPVFAFFHDGSVPLLHG